MKKISISVWIGETFVLLLLVQRYASESLPVDFFTRWTGAPVYATIAASLLISVLIAGLFFVLTSYRTLRD